MMDGVRQSGREGASRVEPIDLRASSMIHPSKPQDASSLAPSLSDLPISFPHEVARQAFLHLPVVPYMSAKRSHHLAGSRYC